MTERNTALAKAIANATQRIRLRLAIRQGALGLLFGSLIGAVIVGLLRTNVFEENVLPGGGWFLILPSLAGAVLGGLMGASRRIDPMGVARVLDERLSLKERLSTSMAFADSDDPFATRQRADAEAHAGNVKELKTAIPLTPLPKHAYIALGLTLSIFLAWTLPDIPAFQSQKTRNEHASVKREGERLVRIAKALEKQADTKKLDGAKKAASKIAALGKEMQKGKMDRRKAMMQLAKLTDEMKQAQRDAATGSSQKSLSAAEKDLTKALAAANASPQSAQDDKQNGLKPPSLADGQKPGANSKAGQGKAATDAKMKKAQDAMKQNDAPGLSEQLSKLADQVSKGEPKSAEERERLAKQLDALSKSLEKTKLSSASEPLKQAAKTLRQQQNAQSAENLREAARRVQEQSRQGDEADAMRQASDALQSGDPSAMEEGQEGQPTDEGMEGDDAYDGEGNAKGKGKGEGQGQGQGGEGQDGGSNGIGSGAGSPNGKKRGAAKKGGGYKDPTGAESGMYDGNWRVKKVKDDKFNRLYTGDQNNTKVNGKRGDKGKESMQYFRGAPDKANSATPYYEVYEKYAPSAESAMSREDIPSSYKKQVKDYFNSIDPKKGGKN